MHSKPHSSPHRSKGSTLALFLFFSGLLLAALIEYVVCLMPAHQEIPPDKRVAIHQEGKNFIAAKKLIAPLLPSPAVTWSGPLICGNAGRGVWLVEGTVEVESSPDGKNPIPWRVVFIPATSQSLDLRLGSHEEGDLHAALLQTGLQVKRP